MKRSGHILFRAGMTGTAVLFLICASVSILLWCSVPLYALAVKLLKIPESSGYSAELCCRNVRALAGYLVLFGKKELIFPDFFMSDTGKTHFLEVRQILLTVQIVAVAGGPMLWLGYREGKALRCLDWLRTAVSVTACLILALLAGILIDRTGTFILFHKLFFTNSYWQFDPAKDPVIEILTEELFLGAAVIIFLLMALGSVIFLRLRRRGGEKRKRNGKAILSHGEKLHRKGHR